MGYKELSLDRSNLLEAASYTVYRRGEVESVEDKAIARVDKARAKATAKLKIEATAPVKSKSSTRKAAPANTATTPTKKQATTAPVPAEATTPTPLDKKLVNREMRLKIFQQGAKVACAIGDPMKYTDALRQNLEGNGELSRILRQTLNQIEGHNNKRNRVVIALVGILRRHGLVRLP